MAKVLLGNVRGPKGETGDQGPRGEQGPAGAAGATGPEGKTGQRGSRWTQGTTIMGEETAETNFPDSGIADALVNDNYLNTSTGNTYRCTVAGTADVAKWVYTGNIKGPKGDIGPKGATGAKGDTGETGPKGDTGATGPQGPKGDVGAQGPKGETGTVGPAGATGATGASMRMKKAWSSDAQYVNNASYIDVVSYNGKAYACLLTHTASASILPTNGTYWQCIADCGFHVVKMTKAAYTALSVKDANTLYLIVG